MAPTEATACQTSPARRRASTRAASHARWGALAACALLAHAALFVPAAGAGPAADQPTSPLSFVSGLGLGGGPAGLRYEQSAPDSSGSFSHGGWRFDLGIRMRLSEGGLTQKNLLETIRRRYSTGLLLGEVRKAEGNTTVTLGNAVSRYTEMGFVAARGGSKARERIIVPGPNFGALKGVERRLADHLQLP